MKILPLSTVQFGRRWPIREGGKDLSPGNAYTLHLVQFPFTDQGHNVVVERGHCWRVLGCSWPCCYRYRYWCPGYVSHRATNYLRALPNAHKLSQLC